MFSDELISEFKNEFEDKLFTRQEASDFIDIPYHTLNVGDSTKRQDFKPIKQNGRILYRSGVLVDFLLEEMKLLNF